MINVNTKDLVKAIGQAGRVMMNRNTIPILDTMRIRRDGESIVLSGTDMDIQADVAILIADGSDLESLDIALCNPASVAKAIKAGGDEITSLQFDGEKTATIKSGSLAIKAATLPAEDWPAMLTYGIPFFHATLGENAVKAFKRLRGAVSTEETRYYLNGIYFCAEKDDPGNFVGVSTDGHRMYMNDFALLDAAGELPYSIIPRRAVDAFLALALPASKDPIHMEAVLKTPPNATGATLAPTPASCPLLQFRMGNVRLLTKLIDGTYPDYQRIIPKENKIVATFNRAELCRVVKAVSAGDKGSRPTAMSILMAGNVATIAKKWSDATSIATMQLPFEGNANLEIGFNSEYVLGALDFYSHNETITLLLDDASQPALVESTSDITGRIVLMPMRV